MYKFKAFKKVWHKANNNIFRLEALPEYEVGYDLVNFQKFKKGEKRNDNMAWLSAEDKEWLALLSDTTKKGVNISRVRVVSVPFSDYLKYEIYYWQSFSIKRGEGILFIKNDEYEKIKLKLLFKPEDFWLFDDKELIIFHYTLKGEIKREEYVKDKQIVKLYKNFKKELFNKTLPMQQFMKDI